MVRGSRPEDKAVSWILETRLYLRPLKSEDVLINDQLLEIGRYELLLLLRISLDAVGSVKLLKFSLQQGAC